MHQRNKWLSENAWKTKNNNRPGKFWRFLEKNLALSKTYIDKFRKNKVGWLPVPYVIDFDEPLIYVSSYDEQVARFKAYKDREI